MAGDREMLDSVMKLSDEELFEKLQEHGFSVGPIVDSTRSVYQKKLVQILEGGYVASPDYSDSDDGEEAHHSDNAHLSDNEKSLRHRTPQTQPSPFTSNLSGLSFEHSGSPYGVTSRPSLSTVSGKEPFESPSSRPVPNSTSQLKVESSASGFSKNKLIAVVVVAVTLAFLLYYNLEAGQDSNPVPKISHT